MHVNVVYLSGSHSKHMMAILHDMATEKYMSDVASVYVDGMIIAAAILHISRCRTKLQTR